MSLLLLIASAPISNYYVRPGYATAEIIDVPDANDFCSIYGDLIAFCKLFHIAGRDYWNLTYFNIATKVLTVTNYTEAIVFHSLYENSVANLVILSIADMMYYDVSTGQTERIHMDSFPDVIDGDDMVMWIDKWWNFGARPISTYGNITAFVESWTGASYVDRSYPGKWFNIEPTAFGGVSVYQDIIAFSNGTICYYNLTTATTISTGQKGYAPSVYRDIIAFTNGSIIMYHNITNGQTTLVAPGCDPSIYENTIVFSTNETEAGIDLNDDGDTADWIIRYYNIPLGTVANTMEVGRHPSIYANTIAFSSMEQWLGVDINEDGDMKDWAIMYMTKSEHDIATTYVTTSTTIVHQGFPVRINVTVSNQGIFAETFEVTAYYCDGIFTPEQWENFWSRGDANRDGYINMNDYDIIRAAFWSTPEDPNWNPDADLNKNLVVDISDLSIWSLNYGSVIWIYFGTAIETLPVVNLPNGISTNITFTWNIAGVPGGNYNISAYAKRVPEETDIIDNTYIDGVVEVLWKGDVNKDDVVDGQDAVIIIDAIPSYPGHPRWNPYADINCDNVVDGQDAVICIDLIPTVYP